MLESIVNFLQAVFGLIVNTFTGIANLFEFVFGGTTIIMTVLAWFPAIVSMFASLSILILIIKFVLGRDN